MPVTYSYQQCRDCCALHPDGSTCRHPEHLKHTASTAFHKPHREELCIKPQLTLEQTHHSTAMNCPPLCQQPQQQSLSDLNVTSTSTNAGTSTTSTNVGIS